MLEKTEPYISKQLKSQARFLSRLGLSPNFITALGGLLALVSAGFYYLKNPLVGAILFFISGWLDLLDGVLAKITKKSSKLGDFYDHVVDRVSDISVFLGIIFSGVVDWGIGILAVVVTLFISYVGASAQSVGLKRPKGGLMGRSDRVALIVIFSLINRLDLAMILIAILGSITILQRSLLIRNALKKRS